MTKQWKLLSNNGRGTSERVTKAERRVANHVVFTHLSPICALTRLTSAEKEEEEEEYSDFSDPFFSPSITIGWICEVREGRGGWSLCNMYSIVYYILYSFILHAIKCDSWVVSKGDKVSFKYQWHQTTDKMKTIFIFLSFVFAPFQIVIVSAVFRRFFCHCQCLYYSEGKRKNPYHFYLVLAIVVIRFLSVTTISTTAVRSTFGRLIQRSLLSPSSWFRPRR